MDTEKQRVIIIEDERLLTEYLLSTVGGRPEYEVLAFAQDGTSGLSICRQHKPDILVLDINIPGLSGLEVAALLLAEQPGIKILAVSSLLTAHVVTRVMELGFSGFVDKFESSEVLCQAIDQVAAGRSYFSKRFLEKKRDFASDPYSFTKTLSNRERNILVLIGQGKHTKDIALALNLSPRTIENHRFNIMKKLDIHDIGGLIRFAIENGIEL